MEEPKDPNMDNVVNLEPDNGAAEPIAVPSELETALKAKEEAVKDLMYQRAEFDNFRKRLLREQDQMVKFANEKFISELLSTIDLLDMAMQHAKPLKSRPDDKEVANFVTGIEMTHKELTNLLTRFGVEFTGTIGEKFDPNRHEAIAKREEAGAESGAVVEVFQRGSLLNGRILKPAKVVVAE